MAGEYERFSSDLDEEMRAIEEQIGQATRKIAIDGLSSTVLKTPVRTGRARANWNVSTGGPDDTTDEGEDKDGTATISEGAQEIQTAKTFEPIWITNNLPYIGVLEDGSSQQAPQGMLSVTVAELETRFRKIK